MAGVVSCVLAAPADCSCNPGPLIADEPSVFERIITNNNDYNNNNNNNNNKNKCAAMYFFVLV